MSYLRLRLAVVVGALLALAGSTSGLAASDGVVISQVYGGGGNSGASFTHDFIELFNRGTTPVVLDGMSVQYASATGTGNLGANAAQLTELSGTIQPGKYVLIHEISQAAVGAPLPANDVPDLDADRDGRGRRQGRARHGRGLPGLQRRRRPPAGQPAHSNRRPRRLWQRELLRRRLPRLRRSTRPRRRARADNGCTETDENSTDFAALSPPAPRNSATAAFVCGAPTDPSGVGAATPASVPAGASTLLTVTVTPGANPPSTGISVTGDLSEIGGSATQPFYDDGTHGDVAAGNNVFSFGTTVAAATTPGAKSLPGGDRGRRGAERLRHDRAHGRGAAASLDRDQRDPGRRAPLAATAARRSPPPAS